MTIPDDPAEVSASIEADLEVLPMSGHKPVLHVPISLYHAITQMRRRQILTVRLDVPVQENPPRINLPQLDLAKYVDRTERYALPAQVASGLRHSVLKSDAESNELEFSNFCEKHHVMGVGPGYLIPLGVFDKPKTELSREMFDRLGWSREVSYDQAVSDIRGASSVLDTHRHRMLAYTGYLLTYAQFRTELAQVRQFRRRLARGLGADAPSRIFDASSAHDGSMLTSFLVRWRLSGMSSWRIPQVQGPNETDIPMPSAAVGSQVLTIGASPSTVRSTTRERARAAKAPAAPVPPHLRPWHDVLNRRQTRLQNLGVDQFAHVARIYVWYRLCLCARYRDRLKGNLQHIDAAFAEALSVELQTASMLRQKMATLMHTQ